MRAGRYVLILIHILCTTQSCLGNTSSTIEDTRHNATQIFGCVSSVCSLLHCISPLLPWRMRIADSTLRSSRAVPHPSTDRALRRLTSEVRRDPVHSTRYGRQRYRMASGLLGFPFLSARSKGPQEHPTHPAYTTHPRHLCTLRPVAWLGSKAACEACIEREWLTHQDTHQHKCK